MQVRGAGDLNLPLGTIAKAMAGPLAFAYPAAFRLASRPPKAS